MNARQAIDMLDRQLKSHGETVDLSRLGGATVSIRARITGYKPEALVGDIGQGDMLLICSPTQMNAASWPLPPERGDKILRDSVTFNVEGANVIKLDDTIVRIELQVRG